MRLTPPPPSPTPPAIPPRGGYSLVELLVVCACAAALALGALAGLSSWRWRHQRQDGWLALQAVQGAQADCRWRLGRFCTDWSELGLPAVSPKGHFRLSLVSVPNAHSAPSTSTAAYTVQALALADQHSDSECVRLMLHEDLWRSRRWAEPGPSACDLS